MRTGSGSGGFDCWSGGGLHIATNGQSKSKEKKLASKLASVLLAPMLSFSALGLHAEESAVTASPPAPQRSSGLQAPAIPRFEIVRFNVEGNTLLPTSALDELLKPYTGKQRDFGDVQRAQEALENAYSILGYSAVRVALPEQELNNGVVRFRVSETRIGKVTVEGNRFFDEANIRRSLPGLRAGEAPNLAAISRSRKVANENPSRKTNLQLQGGEKDGEIDALLKVADEKTWSAGVSFDNSGDANTGRNRMNVLLQNASLGGLDHVASLQYTTSLSHPHNVAVYGFRYHVPLYSLGDSIDVFGSYSDVDSGTVSAGLFDLLVSGKGTTLGSRYNHNFDRVGNYESKLIGGLDYKAFKNSVSLQGIPLGNDITVHPLGLTYSAGAEVSDFYVSGVGNLPGGDHGGSSDFALIRSGARPAKGRIARCVRCHWPAQPRCRFLHHAGQAQSKRSALTSAPCFARAIAEGSRPQAGPFQSMDYMWT
jgi:hemolysin activation/secretion protein